MNWKGAILAIIPVFAFGEAVKDDLFFISETSDQSLCHIAYDERDFIEELDLDDQSDRRLSLLEIDEDDPSLLPWGADELAAKEEFSGFIERRAAEINEEFENVFAYDLPTYRSGEEVRPSLEKVPDSKKHLYGHRPRVVQSQPDQKKGASEGAVASKDRRERRSETAKNSDKKKLIYTN